MIQNSAHCNQPWKTGGVQRARARHFCNTVYKVPCRGGRDDLFSYLGIHSFTHSSTLGHLWTTASSADPEETLPRKFCLNDSGCFLIIADSLASGDQHLLSQKSKGFTLVVLSSNTTRTTANLTVSVEWGGPLGIFLHKQSSLPVLS